MLANHLTRPDANTKAQQLLDQIADVLIDGALPGETDGFDDDAGRAAAAALRATGRVRDRGFSRYHDVLSRSRWSPLAAARLLFGLLLAAFVPPGPVMIGLDDTIERRWGMKIAAHGIYRHPVRSSHGHFVKASGPRWQSAMLLVPIPRDRQVGALPFLTTLVPSERWARSRGVGHKTLVGGARQMLLQIARWMPDRRIVAVADSSFAVIDLLDAVRSRVCMVTRLRLDARLFAPASPRRPKAIGRPPRTGAKLPTLAQRLIDPATSWQPLLVTDWYGTGERCARSRPAVRSGTIPAGPSYRYAGSSCVIPPDASDRSRSSPPIPKPTLPTCSRDSSVAGPSRSPSPRSAATSTSRRNGNGPIARSHARQRCCSACSRLLRHSLTTSSGSIQALRDSLAGTSRKRSPSLMPSRQSGGNYGPTRLP